MPKKISELKLFRELDKEEIKLIVKSSRIIKYKKDDVIFKAGDKGDSLFVIMEGSVRISANIEGVGEETLAVLKAGEVFGEMSVLDRACRSAFAISHEDSILLTIMIEDFYHMLDYHEEIAVKVLREFTNNFCLRFKNTCESLKNFYLMNSMFK